MTIAMLAKSLRDAGLGGGEQGPKGDKGDPGTNGIDGANGADGAQGIPGTNGTDGINGDKGDKGDPGDPGLGAPVYAALSSGVTAMAFGTNTCVKITPSATQTFTTTVPAAGTPCTLIILTSGTTSRTITFGAGFKPTGTLATGTTNARVFVIHWISDGTNLYESGRTVAMAA